MNLVMLVLLVVCYAICPVLASFAGFSEVFFSTWYAVHLEKKTTISFKLNETSLLLHLEPNYLHLLKAHPLIFKMIESFFHLRLSFSN